MKSLNATISVVKSKDRRRRYRWHVELLVSLWPSIGQGSALVRNLSEDGMLLETDAELAQSDSIVVDLPGAPQTEARVVWRNGVSYGCAFMSPIPSAAISAALLQAPWKDRFEQAVDESLCEEFPIAISPSVDELADWKADFERSKGRYGYQVIAYRQDSDGLMIAIAMKTTRD